MEMDHNKLTRDYRINPIHLKSEIICNDLSYLYLEMNLSLIEVGKIFGISAETVRSAVKEYGLMKSKEQVQAQKRKNYKEKTGYDYPGQNPEVYDAAIETWTIRDPLKRKVVRENKLNWLEFFSEEEFDNWLKAV